MVCGTSPASRPVAVYGRDAARREAFATRNGYARSVRFDRRRVRRPRRRPCDRVPAEPAPHRGGSGGCAPRQGVACTKPLGQDRRGGRRDASAGRSRPASGTATSRTWCSTPRSCACARWWKRALSARRSRSVRAKATAARTRPTSGTRRRPAAGRSLTWRRTASRPPGTCSARTSASVMRSPGATRWSTRDRTTGEDNAVMLMRFEDGRTATMDVSWSSKGGLEGRFELSGTGGPDHLGHGVDAAARVHRAVRRATLPRRPMPTPAGSSRYPTRRTPMATTR